LSLRLKTHNSVRHSTQPMDATRLFSTPPLVNFTQDVDMYVNGGRISHYHTRPETTT